MKKIYALLLCFVALWTAMACPGVAYAEGDDAGKCFESYLAYYSCSDMQEYLDGARSGARLDAAFCMRRYREGLDFSAAADSIDLSSVGSASTREKQTFYLKAFGRDVSGKKEDVYGMGLMSKVFGLHLLKNGISIEGVTKEELVSDIVSTQQEDGGWTLFTVSDVDVTAMCLQALSGECEQEYITKAVTFLSQKQLSDGTFISMGVSNCESCAQVIIALSALGIDGNTDERFIKEKSAYEGLLSFKTSGGLFCHVAGGEYKESSTVQALSALVSYKLYKEGRGAFYAIPDYRFGATKKTAEKVNLPVNAWVAVGIAGVAVLLCVVLLVTKKGGWKEITVIVVVACGLALFIGLSTFQTVDEYYADSPYQGETVSVYVSIRKDVVDPLSPVIFSDTVDVKKDGNVLDAMIVATRKGKLQFSYVTGYISSIDNLAEFSYGNESGWLFAVNGVFSDRCCA